MMRIRRDAFSQMRELRVAGPSWDFVVGSEKKIEEEEEKEKAEWIKMEGTGDRKSVIMTVMRAGFVKDYVLCREEASFFSALSFQHGGCDWREELRVAERDGVIILDWEGGDNEVEVRMGCMRKRNLGVSCSPLNADVY